MNREQTRQRGKGPLEMIEEGTRTLRGLPVHLFTAYYAGSLPFVLGFLYFWADMSHGAFANKHAAGAAFSVALLFIWMKFGHTVFMGHLGAHIRNEPSAGWSFRRAVRAVAVQTAIQPSGLFILPAAMLLTIPFGWAYAFYQNVSFFGNGETGDIKSVFLNARRHAMLFPMQNTLILLVLFLFGFFVFVNIFAALFLLPQLINALLGIETLSSMAGTSMLNTTSLTAVFGITFLVVDPVVKAIYVLRCFYGESLATGEDLKVEIRNCRTRKDIFAVLAALITLFSFFSAHETAASVMPAHVSGGQSRTTSVSPAQIDGAIGKVIEKAEYSWRMPREKPEKKRGGPIADFIAGMLDTLGDWLGPIRKWFSGVIEWIIVHLDKWARMSKDDRSGASPWNHSVYILVYALLAAAVCVATVLVLRRWKRKGERSIHTVGEPIIFQKPDLSDENIYAGDLPAQRWMELAMELMEKGDVRLALRASYLAGLAHLSWAGAITLAVFKSNRDYERELQRKVRDESRLLSAFSQNTRSFESVWYGMHDVSGDVLDAFDENQKRIMSFAEN